MKYIHVQEHRICISSPWSKVPKYSIFMLLDGQAEAWHAKSPQDARKDIHHRLRYDGFCTHASSELGLMY